MTTTHGSTLGGEDVHSDGGDRRYELRPASHHLSYSGQRRLALGYRTVFAPVQNGRLSRGNLLIRVSSPLQAIQRGRQRDYRVHFEQKPAAEAETKKRPAREVPYLCSFLLN